MMEMFCTDKTNKVLGPLQKSRAGAVGAQRLCKRPTSDSAAGGWQFRPPPQAHWVELTPLQNDPQLKAEVSFTRHPGLRSSR